MFKLVNNTNKIVDSIKINFIFRVFIKPGTSSSIEMNIALI